MKNTVVWTMRCCVKHQCTLPMPICCFSHLSRVSRNCITTAFVAFYRWWTEAPRREKCSSFNASLRFRRSWPHLGHTLISPTRKWNHSFVGLHYRLPMVSRSSSRIGKNHRERLDEIRLYSRSSDGVHAHHSDFFDLLENSVSRWKGL